jgi:hypothetical protein
MSSPDEGIYSVNLDTVHGLNGRLDLALVGADINDKYKGVVIFNLLHSRLGREGELQDLEVIELGSRGDGLDNDLGGASKLQGLGLVELDLGVDAGGLSAGALLKSASDLLSLSGGGSLLSNSFSCSYKNNTLERGLRCDKSNLITRV